MSSGYMIFSHSDIDVPKGVVRVVENMDLVILVISARLKELGMSSVGLKISVSYKKLKNKVYLFTSQPASTCVMDQHGHVQPPAVGMPAVFTASSAQLAQHQLAYQHIHQQQQQQLQQQLQTFWANQYQEIEQTADFKNHSLPLARIKKIMKADEDVRMISAEAPVIFARACEMFILELTLRSWNHTEENKRRTLQKNDIAAAITRTDIFDFLVDIVPREDLKDEVLASVPRGTLPVGGPADALPYYYMPHQLAPQVSAPEMTVGKPVGDQALYSQQSRPYVAQQVWPQQTQ
ncbi:hypothetical protein OIU77_011312 [Salix suchowensis]|uniref:Transcription factor CBF/NF-Y/archaeal histone domain-containing protein n=1 Tax=Salix suchowensis TaxID=1278906 RepID=A0ABQ8ZZQ5_9ROSI|nr:hypothetical protein OIU77_011312 [Salix suchowensis]